MACLPKFLLTYSKAPTKVGAFLNELVAPTNTLNISFNVLTYFYAFDN